MYICMYVCIYIYICIYIYAEGRWNASNLILRISIYLHTWGQGECFKLEFWGGTSRTKCTSPSSIREHTWAYVSIREHTWAYVRNSEAKQFAQSAHRLAANVSICTFVPVKQVKCAPSSRPEGIYILLHTYFYTHIFWGYVYTII